MKENNKVRSRKFVILLYPENLQHVAVLEKIKSSMDYIGILHDKDLDESGNQKKSHWHIIIEFKSACWNSAISKDLGLPVNFIQVVRNENAALGYLIHYNEETKYQYPQDEIFGNKRLVDKLTAIIESQELSEGDKVIELLDLIDAADTKITLTSFARYAAAADRWDIFRRGAGIFLKIIEEKNNLIN